MFNKREKRIDEKLKKLETEKEELLKIKELLEDKTPKIDIKDVYVWQVNGICYIVKQYITPITGTVLGPRGPIRRGFESTLVDIFSNDVRYVKSSTQLIEKKQILKNIDGEYRNGYAYFYHILDVDKDLLMYADGKVPLYVLQQLFYRLNNIDVTKTKTKVK